ncbi:MAG: UDP-N-acetylmuramoyl-L-alanine--D-glutamate ligase [Candidatus Dependentiae bacterium]|nr:UDP-N-acetylmuramoyl-L-alanine--D-glutamate ligase [Candidatus Dependentiae bacterium]
MINLKNKRVGIWGLGVVGKSVLNYVKQFTSQIQILDKKAHEELLVILQTPTSLKEFLDNNDIIIPSPGISLLDYQKYAGKFVQELDIFSSESKIPTIAITGTLGKTTITSFTEQCIPNSVAAGNIGYAMLNVLNLQPQPKTVVLELSSYQLQHTKYFAPDIAVLTNFYPNHLDHHATMEEYLLAKCQIFKNQRNDQKSLIPYELIDQIEDIIQKVPSRVYLFCTNKPETDITYPTFYIENNNLILLSTSGEQCIIFDQIGKLPQTTFLQNWVAILATLYLYKIDLKTVMPTINALNLPEHRVELVAHFYNVAIYNDSKSTVWQATAKAVDRFPGKKIALFLGGLSKGTDRSPLIEHCKNQEITVFAFGKESESLNNLCEKYQVPCIQTTTLEAALDVFRKNYKKFDLLLFSPAGSSFDLFKNFEDRGTQFKAMIHKMIKA